MILRSTDAQNEILSGPWFRRPHSLIFKTSWDAAFSTLLSHAVWLIKPDLAEGKHEAPVEPAGCCRQLMRTGVRSCQGTAPPSLDARSKHRPLNAQGPNQSDLCRAADCLPSPSSLRSV